MSRFYDTECIIHRPVKTLGAYNRPSYSLQEVGRCMVSFDKAGVNTLVQLTPQAAINDRYIVYCNISVDIQAGDILEINGLKYRAGQPLKYRQHQEVGLSLYEEV